MWSDIRTLFFVPFAAWLLLSGLDDLFVALLFVCGVGRRHQLPRSPELIAGAPERRIAILIPLWKEARVIGAMLDRNLSGLQYRNYDVFAGVYPNDHETATAVREASLRHPRVHLALNTHDGPTCKGDCLNATYRRMREFEEAHKTRFTVVMIHDAEDLIHPDSLRLVNWYSHSHGMIQIPVLPLPTPALELTHGTYCDEFAESHTREIPVRLAMGGFLAGAGVGTGFSREALERLAESRGGNVFDPASLTEDYDTGYRLSALGFRQVFVPLSPGPAAPCATREYFPRHFRAAVRQKSRWVAGICLQNWELHGWPRGQRYWFWRDRKGLAGNLLTPIANLMAVMALLGGPNAMPPSWPAALTWTALVPSLFQVAMRSSIVARTYGWRFAWAAPLRVLWGNLINFAATSQAIRQYGLARIRHQGLAWHKTDHAFPGFISPSASRPRLGEILLGRHALDAATLELALAEVPRGVRLGEHLLSRNLIAEHTLLEALALQSGIAWGNLEDAEITRAATRVLPAAEARRWRVLPYRIETGQLHLLTSEPPSDEMSHVLRRFSSLELRFRLVAARELDRIAGLELKQPAAASLR